MAELSSLNDLPTEILWRIASSGPAESVLALIGVNRRLREALFDPYLFKNIVKYQLDSAGIDFDHIATILGIDTSLWARLAVADSKVRLNRWIISTHKESLELPLEAISLLRNLDRYAPALVTLKHPTILDSRATEILLEPFWAAFYRSRHRMFVSKIAYDTAMELVSPGLAFYLCANTLSSIQSFPGYDNGVFASKLVRACVRAVEELDIERGEIFEKTYTPRLAHISLSGWASLLSAHIEMAGHENEPRIPMPARIPWLSMGVEGQFPMPFVESCTPDGDGHTHGAIVTWDEWYVNCIESMADPANLVDGEWCGYWSFDNYAIGSPSVSFAEAIERMQLVVPPIRRSSRYGRAPIPIIATYPGSNHDFVLEGHMTHDGIFDLGPQGDSWVWRGRITPFGLFGYWGSADWSRIAGACWLWKRIWCSPVPQDKK